MSESKHRYGGLQPSDFPADEDFSDLSDQQIDELYHLLILKFAPGSEFQESDVRRFRQIVLEKEFRRVRRQVRSYKVFLAPK